MDHSTWRSLLAASIVAGLLLAVPVRAAAQGAHSPTTPEEIVATYESLADGILALKKTEKDIYRAILAGGRAHGQVELDRARKAANPPPRATPRGAVKQNGHETL